MFLKQGASSSAHVLRMMFGILSGPMALDGLVFFSNFSTPSTSFVKDLKTTTQNHSGNT
jgi:hypothetical protein